MTELVVKERYVEEKKTAKRCPFCGSSKLKFVDDALFTEFTTSVFCQSCGAKGPNAGDMHNMRDRAQAVDLWNTRINNDWREDPITDKQRELINDMEEFSPYNLPHFTGTTKGEASDYIDKFTKIAHENPWSMEHGY